MALRKRGGIWYCRKMINGRLFRESTGFADRKAVDAGADVELDLVARRSAAFTSSILSGQS